MKPEEISVEELLSLPMSKELRRKASRFLLMMKKKEDEDELQAKSG